VHAIQVQYARVEGQFDGFPIEAPDLEVVPTPTFAGRRIGDVLPPQQGLRHIIVRRVDGVAILDGPKLPDLCAGKFYGLPDLPPFF